MFVKWFIKKNNFFCFFALSTDDSRANFLNRYGFLDCKINCIRQTAYPIGAIALDIAKKSCSNKSGTYPNIQTRANRRLEQDKPAYPFMPLISALFAIKQTECAHLVFN